MGQKSEARSEGVEWEIGERFLPNEISRFEPLNRVEAPYGFPALAGSVTDSQVTRNRLKPGLQTGEVHGDDSSSQSPRVEPLNRLGPALWRLVEVDCASANPRACLLCRHAPGLSSIVCRQPHRLRRLPASTADSHTSVLSDWHILSALHE
jgi:hypothetical protein